MSHPISIRSLMAIDLAATLYRHPAQRENDARELLGMKPVEFHRHVLLLLDDPSALAARPAQVRRLQRLRDRRRRARAA